MVRNDAQKKFIVLVIGLLLCLINGVKSQHISSEVQRFPPKCGVRTVGRNGRIVGGQSAYQGKWPWQVLVKQTTADRRRELGMCGGVLISHKHVITAAHCQPEVSRGKLVVVFGEHDVTGAQNRLTPLVRNVKKMFIHPQYNSRTFDNDVALLEVEPVHLRPHIVHICLPSRSEDFSGKMAVVTGWGELTEGGTLPRILQEVQIPVMNSTQCQRMYMKAGYYKAVRKNQVCAGYSRGGKDSCYGDSGGPLMVKRNDGRWVLVGIVSHSSGCARPNIPTVYMKISAYTQWIISTIRATRI